MMFRNKLLHFSAFLTALVLLVTATPAVTAQEQGYVYLRPFIMVSNTEGNVARKAQEVRAALTGAGFEIAGEYSPFKGAIVMGVTSDAMQVAAAQSDFGGYGAAVRVAVTQVGDKVQVAYHNPKYMASAYRMRSDLGDVAAQLESALGEGKPFGSEGGWRAVQLRKYHYMMFMPYFDDHNKLAEHASYVDAVNAVEAGLAAGKAGTSKVYRVDVKGKDETLFGVALSGKGSNDKDIMDIIDSGELKHTAHLPYEMLVSGNKVYALHGKFRIALNFPDLTMGTFMNISNAPDSIRDALAAAAGGK